MSIKSKIMSAFSLGLFLCSCLFLYIALASNSDMAIEKKKESLVPYTVSALTTPESVTFAEEKIDLTRYDMHERMDRELMAFTYMHATTLMTIKRANRFFPVVDPILKANGVPEDFKYLMAIESSLNIRALSASNAAGFWQLLPETAQQFGLEVNDNVDERYNIEKATVAACNYLKQAYRKYGDWVTVAASYNAGQGRISTELEKQMESHAFDLWLNEETSRYIFRLLAIKEVFTAPIRFGFVLKAANLYPPIQCEIVEVDSSITDLAAFAKEHEISYAQLKEFNLWLRDRMLDNKKGKNYQVMIPDKDDMYYNPEDITPYRKEWVID